MTRPGRTRPSLVSLVTTAGASDERGGPPGLSPRSSWRVRQEVALACSARALIDMTRERVTVLSRLPWRV